MTAPRWTSSRAYPREWRSPGNPDTVSRTNQFVRVLGEIKSFNNKRSVTAAAIRPLTDHNEYLFHQLEVIYVHLQLSKGSGVRRTQRHEGEMGLTRADQGRSRYGP